MTVVVMSALIVTGCSPTEGDQSAETPTPTFSEPASPSPDAEAQPTTSSLEVWQQAIGNTERANATTLEVQLITNVEGFERIVAGVGYVEMDPGFGDITWTDDWGTTREVITSRGHFLDLDGTWLEIERDGALPTTVAFDPLAGLAGATNVVEVGTEDVEGTTTIRLDADLIPSDGRLIMGFSEEELTVFEQADNASLIATIWVDADGQIVRIVREFAASSIDGDPISATSLYLLTNIGQFQPIDVPETADALPAPV